MEQGFLFARFFSQSFQGHRHLSCMKGVFFSIATCSRQGNTYEYA